jgi:hypothetical protein
MDFDAVVAGLVINFVPNPLQGVAEMMRVARPGAPSRLMCGTTPEKTQLIRHFWDAAVKLDAAAQASDEAQRFPLYRSDRLLAMFSNGGFERTECRVLDIPTVFRDFDDYWLPFLGGQGPAPTYCGTLSNDRRAMLRERLRTILPIAPDGSIRLLARAFAVRGIRPA